SGRNDAAGGSIPARKAIRPEVRPAEPTIDPEQVDAVGPLLENPVAGIGQPQPDSGEGSRVADRRRQWDGPPVLERDEGPLARPELGQAPPHPRIAVERGLLALLALHEQLRRRTDAFRQDLEQV